MFVDFKGKVSLVVRNDKINLNNPNSPWPEVFPEFTKQINSYVGNQLTETLTSDFTTTTPVTKIASQITVMEALKSYFNFVVITIGCGVPQIELEGTPQDWQKVFDKTETLRKYKLDWWVDEMEPALKKIVAASKGKVDKTFWCEMFKYHSKGRCGSPTIIDGWIVKFFPYDKDGKRNNLDSLSLRGGLPNEIVKVDLTYLYGDETGKVVEMPLELWAGFVGLTQNNRTFNLKPQIGWMIRKKDMGTPDALKQKLQKEALSDDFWGGIMLTAKSFPKELLDISNIHSLEIYFTDGINIPDEISKIKINCFRMHGTITDDETARVIKLLPHTEVFINGKKVSK